MSAEQFREGKLEQSCSACGRWEAAGSYCTGCARAMGPADWYPNGDLKRRAMAHGRASEIASTRVKRGRGRPDRVSGRSDGTLGLLAGLS